MNMWIEKLNNGKYRFAERYTDYMTGKTRKVSITLEKNTAKTRKEAFDILQAKIDEATTPPKQSDMRFKELIELYLKEQKITVKQSTYRRNYFSCQTLKKIIGENILIENLNAGYIREKFLLTKKDAGTLNEHLKRLKALLRWGYRNDLIQDIKYLDKLERFKDKPHRQKIQDKFLEKEELKELLECMNVELWKELTEFLALSGLRFGEAAALLCSDIDLRQRVIHVTKNWDSINKIVTTPKTETSVRDVYMQDELLSLCKRIINSTAIERKLLSFKRTDLLFSKENGEHIDFFAYNKYLRENSLSAIDRAITPHTLRHTHASLLLEQGIDVDAISSRLGHTNSKITKEIYLHVTERLKEKQNEQLQGIKIL